MLFRTGTGPSHSVRHVHVSMMAGSGSNCNPLPRVTWPNRRPSLPSVRRWFGNLSWFSRDNLVWEDRHRMLKLSIPKQPHCDPHLTWQWVTTKVCGMLHTLPSRTVIKILSGLQSHIQDQQPSLPGPQHPMFFNGHEISSQWSTYIVWQVLAWFFSYVYILFVSKSIECSQSLAQNLTSYLEHGVYLVNPLQLMSLAR